MEAGQGASLQNKADQIFNFIYNLHRTHNPIKNLKVIFSTSKVYHGDAYVSRWTLD